MEVFEAFAIPGAAVIVIFLVAVFWPKSHKGTRTHPAG